MRIVVSFLLALCAFLPSTRADIFVPSTPDEELRAYGDSFGFVGWVNVLDLGGNSLGYATGSLIDPYVVLTTGHLPELSSFQFGTGNYLTRNGQSREVTSYLRHSVYDVGLLFLDSPILDITPVRLYEGEVTIGMELHSAGYGGLGYPGDTIGDLVYDGDKRGSINRLDGWSIFNPDTQFQSIFRQPGHSFFNEMGSQATPGSSGKPILTNQNGEFFQLGVHSQGDLQRFDYRTISSASLVPNQWVRSSMSSVPEPSSLISLTVGLMLSTFYRRRRRS